MSNESIIFYELNGIYLALYDREELAKDVTVDPDGNLWEIAFNPYLKMD
jgi:hypothetical protein